MRIHAEALPSAPALLAQRLELGDSLVVPVRASAARRDNGGSRSRAGRLCVADVLAVVVIEQARVIH